MRHPPHVHRARDRKWSPREMVKQSQKRSTDKRNKKITLAKEPWQKEEPYDPRNDRP